MKLTQKYLRKCLRYNHKTGIFTWRERPKSHFKKGKKQTTAHVHKNWNATYANKVAGSYNGDGYIVIVIDYKHVLAHRLAWLYHYGYMPENLIDHKDKVRHHNCILNLREVNNICNMQNCNISKNNTSGVSGVSWIKKSKKWYASIMILGKTKSLKQHDVFIEAVKARHFEERDNPMWSCSVESSAKKYLIEKGFLIKGE